MRRRPAVLVVLLVVLALVVGCGGGGEHAAHITCDKQHNYALQCKGAALFTAHPLPAAKLKVTPTVQGTDTYGGAAGVASNPATHFNISYLSGAVGGKDWTRADLDAWHAQGKPTGFVFEQGATQAEDGYAEGAANASEALNEANELGAPSYSVVHFAVDTDASGESVKAYFEGAKSILGAERTGAYGSYFVIRDLVEWGIITNRAAWMTRAWSQGLVWTHGGMYQYAIPNMAGTVLSGQQVDRDVAMLPDWGQYPYAQAPPVNPHHYAWLPDKPLMFHALGWTSKWCKLKTKGCHKVLARPRLAAKTFDNLGCRRDNMTHHFKRHGCKIKAQHLRLLSRRWWVIAHRTPNLKHQVKKPRWGATAHKAKGHTTTVGGAYQQMRIRILATAPITAW